MNIVASDTRPLTNDERLARYEERKQQIRPVIFWFEYKGKDFEVTGTVDECMAQADKECRSKMWIFNGLEAA